MTILIGGAPLAPINKGHEADWLAGYEAGLAGVTFHVAPKYDEMALFEVPPHQWQDADKERKAAFAAWARGHARGRVLWLHQQRRVVAAHGIERLSA